MKTVRIGLMFAAAILAVVGCHSQDPDMTELQRAHLAEWQAELNALQAQANPIYDKYKSEIATIEKEHPGFHVDGKTLKLVATTPSGPAVTTK